ncbi:hypothetical protein EJ02DRAFT_428168 [Clathrospora elynae]|uniref:Uncharacterized protein n=1 Tax=Clathrospora elynae TaxID=706981 RepID=A0A6A5S4Z3_9PLEO|nr:hypothetical protein EJ02DRAFT_428168 [Clathrospora elynae]
MALNVHPRNLLLVNLLRVAFLVTLNVEKCEQLVKRVFPDYYDSPQHAWVIRIAIGKVKNNCGQWKCRAINEMEKYVTKALERDPGRAIANTTNPDLLRTLFLQRFNTDDFNTIFAFALPAINWVDTAQLKKSGEAMSKGIWWARTIFTNLAAHVKISFDVAANTTDYNPTLTREGVVKVFNQILNNDVVRKHRPEISDFITKDHFLYKNNRSKAEKKTKFDANRTNLIGCELPPGASWVAGEHYDNVDSMGSVFS